jgi:purine-binding chemotaxis protein CheW
MSTPIQLCTFTVEDMLFGVDVVQVQEVIRFQAMTRVPLAPSMVRGLINLRGQIVTAIDLRIRLGLGPRRDGQLPMNVVLSGVEAPVSLLVDAIGDVISVESRAFETPPSTMKSAQRELVAGVCKLPGRLLLVLDSERVVRAPASGGTEVGRPGTSRSEARS